MTALRSDNEKAIIAELDREPDKAVQDMVDHLAKRPGVAAILFYGNRLRDKTADGLLDLYVLTDSNRAYHGVSVATFLNRILPPNVYFEEIESEAGTVSAKVAVMTQAAFRKRMRPESFDTTLWARFAQPAILVYCRDDDSRQSVTSAIVEAYKTAMWWGMRLSPHAETSSEFWGKLFASTYGAELRVESGKRAETIVAKAPALYEGLYQTLKADTLDTDHGLQATQRARRSWARRRLAGKSLNFLRLIKAATTFRGGIAYALSKVERHSGRPIVLKRWERRLPWLAAPVVFCRLLIERRLR